jgi:RND superfamily putative drug exporter
MVTALSLDLGRWMWWPGKLARQPQAGAPAAQSESEPVRTG